MIARCNACAFSHFHGKRILIPFVVLTFKTLPTVLLERVEGSISLATALKDRLSAVTANRIRMEGITICSLWNFVSRAIKAFEEKRRDFFLLFNALSVDIGLAIHPCICVSIRKLLIYYCKKHNSIALINN